jgi:hypothetical protein
LLSKKGIGIRKFDFVNRKKKNFFDFSDLLNEQEIDTQEFENLLKK